MRLRRRRRHVVVLSTAVGRADRYGTLVRADRYGTPVLVQPRRRGRVRRFFLFGAVLTIISVTGAFRVARLRRRLLTGVVLAGLAVILRDSMWGLVFLLVFLLYLPPWSPEVGHHPT
jgi:hypothetical protein